jgi:dTDP-4-amino-4,6-dideoxygalactose transaminase
MHSFYKTIFQKMENVKIFETQNDDYFSNYWLTTIFLEPNKEKNINRENLQIVFEAANIESRPLWKLMNLQPLFENFPYYEVKIGKNLFDNGLCLPSGSNFSKHEKNRIEEVINAFFK